MWETVLHYLIYNSVLTITRIFLNELHTDTTDSLPLPQLMIFPLFGMGNYVRFMCEQCLMYESFIACYVLIHQWDCNNVLCMLKCKW